MRGYRKSRHEKCIDCKENAHNGSKRCKKHLDMYNENQQMYIQEIRAKAGYYQELGFGKKLRRLLE